MLKRKLIKLLREIRPKADAYDRVCQQLGIDRDILGYIENLQKNHRSKRSFNAVVSNLSAQMLAEMRIWSDHLVCDCTEDQQTGKDPTTCRFCRASTALNTIEETIANEYKIFNDC